MPTESYTPAAGVAERIGAIVDGRYKITELMASGSMGSVYKAERVPVGKLVAIKFLHASFASDAEFQARFERETRVMSKLNHPNCVSVLDFGVWENNPYLVMDYVDGTTLRHRLDKGPMSPYEALAMARQILSGLAHAHQQEIFHRDIKPANIMISDEIGHGERVRILDFGLARLQGNVGRDATQINMVVGTPNYMAPEQTVPGGVIDARTDLYAVGVVLYEMIVGERPFHAEDTLQLLGMHRGAPIPRLANVMKKNVELPKGTQELIDRSMAKSPDDRYQSAIEFAQAIDEVIEGKLDPTMEDVTIPRERDKRKAGTTGMAPTVLQVDSSVMRHEARARVRRSFGSTLFMALIVVAAMAGVTGYLIKRAANRKTTGERHNTAQLAKDAGVGGGTKKKDAGAQHASAAPDAPPTQVAVVGTPADAAVETTTADAAVRLDDAGLPIIGEPDQEEITIDPEKVEDPDPDQGKVIANDEDENAPKTEEEAEKREKEQAPADKLARNLHDAVLLIKQGKKGLAVLSLREIWKKNPKSAYAPFLLGNLYFERKWWSVALDHYRAAIKQNAGYKRNGVLNRNVIRMTASKRTRGKAWNFIRGVTGRWSKPYLRWAARHDPNPVVRKQAKVLNRYVR